MERKDNVIKPSTGERVFQIGLYIFLVIFVLLMVYPFVHIISMAFSTPGEARRIGFHFFPREFELTSVKIVLASDSLWRSVYNTVHRTVLGTFLSLFVTSMGAYALSKRYFIFRGFFLGLILFSMYFNGGIIPQYLLIKSLGLLNSRWAMILPVLVMGFHTIIMITFFSNIPESLEESAKMDGAGDFMVFIRIILPLSLPVMATVTLWVVVFHWNAYFDNLMFINDNDKYVLQRLIRNLLIESDGDAMDLPGNAAETATESIKAATIFLATLPILIVYPFAQRFFMSGMMIGAVKG